MAIDSLQDLYLSGLKDIYYAENKIVKALDKMIKESTDAELQQAFTEHQEETRIQIQRLEQIFSAHGEKAKGEECQAIEGIIEEAEELLGEIDKEGIKDVALIISGQKVEHYEMAAYGSLIALAGQLGHEDDVEILEETLEEEKQADELLTRIAEETVNERAQEMEEAA